MSDVEQVSITEPAESAAQEEQQPVQTEGEEFDSLLNEYAGFTEPTPGSFLRGHIVKVTPTEVIVDVGSKCEGVIPIDEFRDEWGNVRVQPGDEVEVLMESTEVKDGYVKLSREKVRRVRVWDDIESAYQQQKTIQARVVEKVKGGLAVDIGVKAFLPGSHLDIRPVRELDSWIGQEVPCKIIKFHKKRNNIVVSRRALLEEESREQREKLKSILVEGAVIRGKVKNLTEYGAFVELGGIDGLLHITDMSWGRLKHPSDLLSPGQEVEAKVLKYDPEKNRVSLGLKQLTEDPWQTIAERYPVGGKIRGKVLNLTDYGAFVELEPGVEGLIHISEMSWNKRVKHPSKILTTGDMAEVVVLGTNSKDRRVSLGLKQAEPNPWMALEQKYPIGTVVQGQVRSLTDFGAFIEVEEGIDGLVHVSDISWRARVKKPSDILRKGETVKAVVLKIEPEKQRLSLGIKQMQPEIWETYCAQNRAGDTVKGKIVRKAPFGLFVELAEGIEGLCHVSEIPKENDEGEEFKIEEGQEASFQILKMNPSEKKIGLSLKSSKSSHSRKEMDTIRQQHSSSSGATTTLEEMVAMKERNRLR